MSKIKPSSTVTPTIVNAQSIQYIDAVGTQTIDLSDIQRTNHTDSGSFPVLGINSTSIGKLFDALPNPVVLVDKTLTVTFANQACNKLSGNSTAPNGKSIVSVFRTDDEGQNIRSAIENVFNSRKPVVTQGLVRMSDDELMWAKMHFRSLRIGDERFALILVEDLTLERRQLLTKIKHEKELQAARDQLEQRVKARTAELAKRNEDLQREIVQRKEVVKNHKAMLKRLQDTLNGTIIALARMSEKRDPHTAGHQRRTAQLACAIAEKMGFPQDRAEGIAIAAAVHDIGKISIPAEMLSKPGKLSKHEFNIIKCHPEIGHDILKEIASPWPLATIVLQHHERINGTGYPGGLRGDQICLESRIVAVADVVEAMSSHRPYRPPLGRDSAINEIAENKGILYDADVAEACLKIMKNGFAFD